MYCNVERQRDRRQLEVTFGLNTRQQVKFRGCHRRLLSGFSVCGLNKRWTTAAYQVITLTHITWVGQESADAWAPACLSTHLTGLWAS